MQKQQQILSSRGMQNESGIFDSLDVDMLRPDLDEDSFALESHSNQQSLFNIQGSDKTSAIGGKSEIACASEGYRMV